MPTLELWIGGGEAAALKNYQERVVFYWQPVWAPVSPYVSRSFSLLKHIAANGPRQSRDS
jgi:hypothetical protein